MLTKVSCIFEGTGPADLGFDFAKASLGRLAEMSLGVKLRSDLFRGNFER